VSAVVNELFFALWFDFYCRALKHPQQLISTTIDATLKQAQRPRGGASLIRAFKKKAVAVAQ
jgi:hypothetical protein